MKKLAKNTTQYIFQLISWLAKKIMNLLEDLSPIYKSSKTRQYILNSKYRQKSKFYSSFEDSKIVVIMGWDHKEKFMENEEPEWSLKGQIRSETKRQNIVVQLMKGQSRTVILSKTGIKTRKKDWIGNTKFQTKKLEFNLTFKRENKCILNILNF